MGTEFPWRWGRGTISANLDVIWGMSVNDLVLISSNAVDFRDFQGLKVRSWA